MQKALSAGYEVLQKNGSSLEAVEASIKILEDSPLFNAGRGSVLTEDQEISMDAAIVRGWDKSSGAVIGVSRTKNPISLAKEVLQHSKHNTLQGAGADKFANLIKLSKCL